MDCIVVQALLLCVGFAIGPVRIGPGSDDCAWIFAFGRRLGFQSCELLFLTLGAILVRLCFVLVLNLRSFSLEFFLFRQLMNGRGE